MKIVFFGSDDFAATHLKRIIVSEHKVLACVTQPDRPKGRGMNVVLSPIKEIALEHNITVLQPTDIKSDDFLSELKKLEADLYVVIAYGRILPQKVLDVPTRGAINVHPSLLPKYRGAAPINWAIINGDAKTGVTIIQLNAKMDAGDILACKEENIKDDDTSISLRQRLVGIAENLLIKVLGDFQNNTLKGCAQDSSKVSLAPKLTKELGAIDWNKSAVDIHNLVRGLLPWPGGYTLYDGKMLKIIKTKVLVSNNEGLPGVVTDLTEDGIVVATQKGGLLVCQIHLQSAKEMDALSFVRGHRIEKGHRFQ